MSFAELLQPQFLTERLAEYRNGAYAVLFLGAFFETLIPFSLAILGEVFFISGALLAGMGALNVWGVFGVMLLGGVLGDHASYWLGRRYGRGLFDQLARWPLPGRMFKPEGYRRGRAFFRRRGALAVFAARFSGPLSWVMPALAGVFRLDYRTFARFNALGVALGIGQFILVGYFFGVYMPQILDMLGRYAGWGVFGLVCLVGLLWVWRIRVAARHPQRSG
ncbi:MAG: DedA family protein [Candidatus Thiodiazotropha sp.]